MTAIAAMMAKSASSAITARRAAFIDRDGVLNQDLGYVHRWRDFRWLPGAISALAALQQQGFALVVVTNQSGIGRGMYTEAAVDALHGHMREALREQGVALTDICVCPHHPQALLPQYRQLCDCRKPRPRMILRAAREHGLQLAGSRLFGDKPSDIQAGRAAGVGCCWLIGSEAVAVACGADGAAASLQSAVHALRDRAI